MDAYDYWKEKFKARPKLEIYISDYLQKTATEEDLNNHIDIADWLIRWHNDPDTVTLPPETPIQPIQQAQHALTIQDLKRYLSPDSIDQVAQLVEDLDLEIKSVTVPPRANALPMDASGSTSTTARLPEPWWNTFNCAAMTPNSLSLKKRTSP